MHMLSIRATNGDYQVDFGIRNESFLQSKGNRSSLFFVDKTVLALHPWLKAALPKNDTITLMPSERLKSYEGIGDLLRLFVKRGVNKNFHLKVIGGGVLQDAVGFTASIFFRGIDWSFMPTTLLAQADSCIGSKTSLNFGEGKNQLGTFHPPRYICIDPRFLETLTEAQFRSGIGEIFHYLLVSGQADFEYGEDLIDSIGLDREKALPLIERSLKIKKKMIEIDEFDTGPRKVFNYGHTFGHAIEAASGFGIPHGIAVSIGMDIANCFSAKQELVSIKFRNRVRKVLEKIWQSDRLDKVKVNEFISALKKDKKNDGRQVKAILTRGFGDMFLANLDLTDENLIWFEKYFANVLQDTDL